MPSTDQMIADLVAKGFKLPEGLGYQNGYWALGHDPDDPAEGVSGDQFQQQAHDLCAMEFARQWSERHGLSSERPPMHASLGYGDTEGAIKALWEGVCYG